MVADSFGRGALPVVEIEEHRRALSRRAKQIAELAEHPRADAVALVFGKVVPHLALAHEHVEVIHPEVDEDLFELTLAVNRAQDPLLRQLADDVALHAHRLGLLGRTCRSLAGCGRRVGSPCLPGTPLRVAAFAHRGHEIFGGQIA